MKRVMSDKKPAVSVHYLLNLEESQDGFKLATFGKKQITQFITPLISVGLIIWGVYLGASGAGRYYVILGALFLIMQSIVRYALLPIIFKRQFVKYQLGKSEQHLSLYQDYAQLSSAGRTRTFEYSDVKRFCEGKITYILELKSRTVIIIPKRAFASSADQTVFKNTFQ